MNSWSRGDLITNDTYTLMIIAQNNDGGSRRKSEAIVETFVINAPTPTRHKNPGANEFTHHHAYAHHHAHTDPHTGAQQYVACHADVHPHQDRDTDQNRYRDPYANAHGNPHRYPAGHRHPHRDQDEYADTMSDAG